MADTVTDSMGYITVNFKDFLKVRQKITRETRSVTITVSLTKLMLSFDDFFANMYEYVSLL